jgi:hypothetical protein
MFVFACFVFVKILKRIVKFCFCFLRARELFYYLKGGQVDYGEEHSKACGHSQFGRIYEQGLDIGDLHVMFVVCYICEIFV